MIEIITLKPDEDIKCIECKDEVVTRKVKIGMPDGSIIVYYLCDKCSEDYFKKIASLMKKYSKKGRD